MLLPAWFLALGYGAAEIGAVSTVARLGSALMTLGVGLLGARADPRVLLLLAAGLTTATGMGFVFATGLAMLMTIALVGTMNPSAGSMSIFAPLEQTMLTRAAQDSRRNAVFAR